MTTIDPLSLALPTSIATERLLLRPPRTGDGPLLHEALAESIVQLREFLGFLPWVAEPPTLASAEARCRLCEANFLARTDIVYLALDQASGRLVGSVGLHRTDWAVPKTEVGYWIRPSAAGRGYVSEGVLAMVSLAFEGLNAQRIELVTDEQNAASRRVADRCNFQLEGIHRHTHRGADGSLRSSCVYARLRGDR